MKKSNFFSINKNSLIRIYLPIFLISLSIFFLLWNLGGDPSILKGYGDYSDEGFWLQNPINKILYGKFLADDQSQSFFGSPLYNQIITLQFKLFGISFFNARMISIIFLILNTLFLYFFLKSNVNNKNNILLYIASFLLIFDNILYYQWSTPLPVEIFFQSLVLLFLTKYKLNTYRTALVVAFLVYLSILSKTTSVWLIGFVLILFLKDNFTLQNPKIDKYIILKFLFFITVCITPFLLTNYFFLIIEPEKFSSFSLLLKRNINFFNLSRIIDCANPLYYLKGLFVIFKFPNTCFILLMLLISFLIIKINKSKIKLLLLPENRTYFVLFLYIIFFFIFLILIGAFGDDRREINAFFPLFIISILLYDRFSNREIKLHKIILISVFFVIVSLKQIHILYKFLYHPYSGLNYRTPITGLDSQSKIIFAVIFIFYLIISCYLIYRYKLKFLFTSFILINIVFHFIFINNNHSLLDANKKVKEISKEYNVKYISGLFAHHLAIESKVLPVFWIDKTRKYPPWNLHFPLFSKTNPTIITTDMRLNKSDGYFPLKNIPTGFKIIYKDTLFFYRNKFCSSFNDTVLIYIVAM